MPSHTGASSRVTEPRFHLDLDRNKPWSASSSPRLSPFLPEAVGSSHPHSDLPGYPLPDTSEVMGGGVDKDVTRGEAQLAADEPSHSESPRRGLQKYLSRFDDAMKLRGQLANENQAQDAAGSDPEELDSFRLFRLVGSVLLAIFVRGFVCKYLVSRIRKVLHLPLRFLNLFNTTDLFCLRLGCTDCDMRVDLWHFTNLVVLFSSFCSPYLHHFSPSNWPTWGCTSIFQRFEIHLHRYYAVNGAPL
jgi:hypothetical protein